MLSAKNYTNEEMTQMANTIHRQLGGKRFMFMTGTKNPIILNMDQVGIRYNLATNKSGANRLEITMNTDDTYTVRFYRVSINRKTFDCKVVEKSLSKGVYFDQLQEIFTNTTGLYTML